MANPYAEENDPYDYDYQPFGEDKKDTTAAGLNEEALRLKAQELQQREEALNRRERELLERPNNSPASETTQALSNKNWPKCYPLVYHNIGDAQPMCKTYVRLAYFGWMAFSVLLALNFVCALVTVPFRAEDSQNNLATLTRAKLVILSFLFVVFGIPMNFFLSYWPVYRAAVVNNVARYGLAFIGYSFMILFTMVLFAGYYDIGTCGLIVAITYFPSGGHLVPFLANLIFCVLVAAMFVYELVIVFLMYRVFRTRRGTFREAGQEFKTSVVRSATSTVMKEGMNSASSSI